MLLSPNCSLSITVIFAFFGLSISDVRDFEFRMVSVFSSIDELIFLGCSYSRLIFSPQMDACFSITPFKFQL